MQVFHVACLGQRQDGAMQDKAMPPRTAYMQRLVLHKCSGFQQAWLSETDL